MLRGIRPRLVGPYAKIEDEVATIEIAPDHDDQVVTGGPISVKDLTPPRLLVVADVLAKNVALVRDEREVSQGLELIEPFATALPRPAGRPSTGAACCAWSARRCWSTSASPAASRSRKSPTCCGTAATSNGSTRGSATSTNSRSGPTRCATSSTIIQETTRALTDIIDTERSVRLEASIVLLIVVEVLIAFYDLFFRMQK